MDRDEALTAIESDETIQRLRAARVLSEQAQEEDATRIRLARDAEPDVLVRRVLERALATATSQGNTIPESAILLVPTDPDLADLYGKAVEDVGRLFLHEMRPLLGNLELTLIRENGLEYDGPLVTGIERIRGFLDAIQNLRDASAVPIREEFDLTDFVRLTAQEEGILELDSDVESDDRMPEDVPQVRGLLARDDPVVVRGDTRLLRLALANALRNAREAVEGLEPSQRSITINWGITDRDAWIAVLDRGIGLPDAYEDLKLPGVTSKPKDEHDGMGLTVAERAMVSLGGSLKLAPRRDRGAACEMRWPQPDTSSNNAEHPPG